MARKFRSISTSVYVNSILVGVFFTGSAAINDNGVLGGSAALIVIGLIVYIVLNKRIVD